MMASKHSDKWTDRLLPFLFAAILGQHALYTSVKQIFEHYPASEYFGLPPASPKYCPTDEPCERPDLLAFSIVSFLAFVGCTSLGGYAWYGNRVKKLLPWTPAGRVYGVLPELAYLAAWNTSYQLWDLYMSFQIPEFMTPILLCHHTVAAVVCYAGLYGEVLGYYAAVFASLSEMSSLFLVPLDASEYFPPTVVGSAYDTFIHGVCAPLFTLTFTYYRVWMWWPATIRLWSDIYHLRESGQDEKLRPGKTWVPLLQGLMAVPMGLLQLYWLGQIVQKIVEMVATE